jgi:hypothetical protein
MQPRANREHVGHLAAAARTADRTAVTSMWTPWGAVRVDGVPIVGALLADVHAVWEVTDVVEIDSDGDWPGARTHVLSLASRTGPLAVRTVATGPYSAWWTYPGRFPMCSCCGEPWPCRACLAESDADRELSRTRCFETAGRCPGCGEPVERDQSQVTFPDNLEVPMGPPVTYHLGWTRCRIAAGEYQQAWLCRYPGTLPLFDEWCAGTC